MKQYDKCHKIPMRIRIILHQEIRSIVDAQISTLNKKA
jgi:hypothetical protein